MSRLDSQMDSAFRRLFGKQEEPMAIHRGEPKSGLFGPILEVDPEVTPEQPTDEPRLATSSELAQYQELFDLQAQQMTRIAKMNQDSMDSLANFLEKLGFADQLLQKNRTENMLTILERLGMVTPTEEQPQPEGPTPVATQ